MIDLDVIDETHPFVRRLNVAEKRRSRLPRCCRCWTRQVAGPKHADQTRTPLAIVATIILMNYSLDRLRVAYISRIVHRRRSVGSIHCGHQKVDRESMLSLRVTNKAQREKKHMESALSLSFA